MKKQGGAAMTYNRTSFDDPFDAPHAYGEDSGLYVDPSVVITLMAVVVVLGVLGLAAWYVGRRQGRKKIQADLQAAAISIYESIDYHLDKALTAPGTLIIERARALADLIEARLGLVVALDGRYGALSDGLKKALSGPIEIKPDVTAKAKVAMSADAQRIKVWEALQKLHGFWSDRDAVMTLIREAQAELTKVVAEKPLKAHAEKVAPKPEKTKPQTAKKERKKREVPEMAKVPQDIILPPEKPAKRSEPRPRVGKKNLPRHKKNMLA